jgi:pyridoxamine 5'-phosphate oxidase
LTFATDLRSPKTAELAHSPWVEVCWSFPVTHEQFRIGGPITVVGNDATDDRVPFPRDHPDPETPLPHFGLLVLDPQTVDLLEINGHPQNRWEFHRNEKGSWSGLEINP